MSRRHVAVLGSGLAAVMLAGCGASASEQAGPAAPSAKPASSSAPSDDGASASPKSKPSKSAGSNDGMGDMSYVPQVAPDTGSSSGGGVQVHYKVSTKKKVFFITVDDGYTKQPAALDYIAARRLPVTTFLTRAAVNGEWGYFSKFSAYDAVQNHSMTHKALSLSTTNRNVEICEPQRLYAAKYGTRPWILRPPYGAGFMPERGSASAIKAVAASCGIRHVALWNVTVSAAGKVSFASGSTLEAGDIVLMHFEGDVARNLRKIVAMGQRQGLTPASLSAFLPR